MYLFFNQGISVLRILENGKGKKKVKYLYILGENMYACILMEQSKYPTIE